MTASTTDASNDPPRRRRLRRDHRGRFARRAPDPVGPATMAALMRAYALDDREGVRAIVNTCDPGLLIDRLLEAVKYMGQARYGTPENFAAAMGDLLGWLAAYEASRGSG